MDRKGYVICGDHRSGSNYLCQLLTSTDVLGRPSEVFSDPARAIEVERDPSALGRILEEASTPNGLYGLKVFTQQFDVSRKSGWPRRLPGLEFVHLGRRDLLGQAISYVRSIQTDQYRSNEEARAEPRFDAVAIAGHLARLADNEARWRRYFARNGIDVLWLTYEQVAADPQGAVEAVASHVGWAEPAVADLARVSVAVQRDEASEEWRRRFVDRYGDLTFLDHRHGQFRVWLRRLARDLRYSRRLERRR